MLASSADNIQSDVHVPVAWVWAAPDVAATAESFASLHARLSAALAALLPVHFPSAASRISHDPDAGYTFAPLPASGLEPGSVPLQTAEDLAAPAIPAAGPLPESWALPAAAFAPRAAVGLDVASWFRLTRMRGGVVLVAALHHAVGDMRAMTMIMTALSDAVEGRAVDGLHVVHDRALMRGDPSKAPEAVPKACRVVIDNAEAVLAAEGSDRRPFRRRYSREEINVLKKELACDGFEPTTNDIVCAIALQDAAKSLSAEEDVGLLFPADVRGRFRSVPKEYFGNAIALCTTPLSTAGAVVDAQLRDLVRMVHDAKVAGMATEEIDAVLNWEAARRNRPRAFIGPEGRRLGLTNWSTFPIFDVTCGLGTPVAIVPCYPGWLPFLGFVLPVEPSAGSGVDVIITL